MTFSGEVAQTRDNPQLREEAEWRRACMQKELFLQMHGMFSEAQDNEKRMVGHTKLSFSSDKNCTWNIGSLLEPINGR